MTLPAVTVVVPAYNEEHTLADCLRAIQRQDYAGPFEIVVVDNASTDRTAALARDLGARVVREQRKGVGYAAAAGFATAHGEIIARTDADTLVDPDWLRRLVNLLTSRPDVVAAGGTYRFRDGSPWLRALGALAAAGMMGLYGANLAVWRWAYQQVGGFDGTLACSEDADLGLRLRALGRVVIDRRLTVATSSRRFQRGVAATLWHYTLNYLGVRLLRRPVRNALADIREHDAMRGRELCLSVAEDGSEAREASSRAQSSRARSGRD